jgi:enoyl-CoA hydratase/carnithine racemase
MKQAENLIKIGNQAASNQHVNSDHHVMLQVRGCAGLITLNRPNALNALSLPMIRQITAALLDWKSQPDIKLVAIRGMGKNPAHATDSSAPAFTPFGSFCAGGDIRFFYQAALTGDPALEDFFTEEYALNHLIHTYPKPYIAFMDGIVMGGGMGISQGASHRIVTERTKMAMPETGIGLFPDVGGGYFLSRCPGRVGEYLALTGQTINGGTAVQLHLADYIVASEDLPMFWDALCENKFEHEQHFGRWMNDYYWNELRMKDKSSHHSIYEELLKTKKDCDADQSTITRFFSSNTIIEIINLLDVDPSDWAADTATTLRKRSPLMLHVVLELIRRARSMTLADDLRLERDLVRHCFHTAHLQRSGVRSETVEGIRALAVDKDHAPQWNPARIEDVTPAMVQPFFQSPWPVAAHPLRTLA